MSTNLQLSSGSYAEVAYALVIDGINSIFVTHEDLAGGIEDGSSWIGSEVSPFTNASVTASLEFPRSLPMSVNLVNGTLQPKQASFTLYDTDDRLVNLFAAKREDVKKLKDHILASDNAATVATKKTEFGDLITGSHVGIEQIGPNGERRVNPCHPGFAGYGLEHPGIESELGSVAPVSSEPLLWLGRKYVLYAVHKNVNQYGEGSWTSFNEMTGSIAYWGAMTDAGRVEQKKFMLNVDGPEAWIRKPLNQDGGKTVPVFGAVNLTDVERKVRLQFAATLYQDLSTDGGTPDFPVMSAVDDFEDSLTGDTAGEIANSLQTLIDAAKNKNENAGPFTGNGASESKFDFFPGPNKFHISTFRTGKQAGKFASWLATVNVCLHEKIWHLLGYTADQRYIEFDSQQYLEIRPFDPDEAPGPGFLTAKFVTLPLGYHAEDVGKVIEDGQPPSEDGKSRPDNDGETRTYEPLFKEGVYTIDPFYSGSQTLFINAERYRVQGQLSMPPASDPNNITAAYDLPDVGEVDKQRLFVLHGPRRVLGEEEAIEEKQVIMCSWKDNDGFVSNATESPFKPTLLIVDWLRPRRFGIDRPKLKSPWLGIVNAEDEDAQIKLTPLAAWKYANGDVRDYADIVIQRILRGTGTSTGWNSYHLDVDAAIDPGENNANADDNGNTIRTDAEIYDLSCGIPGAFMESPDYFKTIRHQISPGFRRVNAYATETEEAKKIIRPIMQTRGWVWSLNGGKYGIVSPYEQVDPSDVDVVLSVESFHQTPGKESWPIQDIRAGAPEAKYEMERFWDPIDDSYDEERAFEHKANDQGSFYRTRQVTRSWSDPTLVGGGWTDGLIAHLQDRARFWEERHFILTVDVHRTISRDCWPGTKVLVTDPRLVSQLGEYGVTLFTGLITSVIRKPKQERATIQILVHASNVNLSFYAPQARAIGYDSSTNRIYCVDNWLNIPGDSFFDVNHFVEPSWTGGAYGGNAVISVWQWDRNTWRKRGNATVSSINAVAGSAYIELTEALGFTYYRDQDTLITFADSEDQTAAWVIALYSPTANESGKVAGEPSNKKFI